MKKLILIFLQFSLLGFAHKTFAQVELGSQFIDTVYDSRGNKIPLSDIRIPKTIGGGATVSAISSTCQAGKFTLYFEAGSLFDASQDMQNVACQVFLDVSNLITSSIGNGGVRIHCRDYTGGGSAVAVAGSYFCFPKNPVNFNQGIVDGQVYKTLVSGVDSYSNMPLSLQNANGFYHGAVEVAPNTNTAITVSYNMTTTAIASNELDFYSIMLHEAMHALGVLSLIQHSVGASAMTTSLYVSQNLITHNYFSRYDKFLYTNAGVPLLVPSNSLCPNSGLTFAPSPSAIAVQQADSPYANPQNVTTCSTAAKYVSASTTLTLYTPDYFESGSSLSHFEDMCSGSYGGTCTPSPSSPGYNDFIYVMSNATGTGPCYVKRHITDAEQKVLCDLGYSVAGSYGSSAVAGSTINFSGGCTPSVPIYGHNDGMSNYVYTYSTTTNSIVISTSSLLSNDSPTTGLTVSCMEMVSFGATLIPVSGGNFTVQAAAGSGLYILKYYPKDISTGEIGNVTYVAIYFISAGCISCDVISNGDFESTQTVGNANLCGTLGNSTRWFDCWENHNATAGSSLASTLCSTIATSYLSTNASIEPQVNPLSTPLPNTKCAKFILGANTANLGAIKNNLTFPLVTGTYQVSFWVNNVSPGPTSTVATINPSANPVVITVATSTVGPSVPSGIFPAGLDIVKQSTVNAGPFWTQVTYTFAYTGASPALAVFIGLDAVQAFPPSSAWSYNVFIDEFSINPITAPSLAIPGGSVCSIQSFTDLAQYLTTPTVAGVFSGPGVSYNGVNYDFNLNGALSPAPYPIAFTYTTSGGCSNTIYQQIEVKNCCNTSTLAVYNPSTTLVAGPKRIASSFTLAASSLYMMTGELLIDPGVKITVPSTSTLLINGSHLYSCANLWQGIEISSGGKLLAQAGSGKDNLIEDAEIAVDISNYYYGGGLSNGFINLQNVIFNKNRIGINLSNYLVAINSYSVPIVLDNCVFTCRSFTFNSTTWPTTATSDLRSVGNPTTGLDSPYLLRNAPLAFLKAPYAGLPSHAAINLMNSGATTTTSPPAFTFIRLGSSATASLFTLFDAHEYFIKASNSNVKVENSVFQNTRNTSQNVFSVTGTAIEFKSTLPNVCLDLSAASINVGNRFWNCNAGIDIVEGHSFKLDHALFRSLQSSSFPTFVGERAISVNSNRIYDYDIQYNEFTNVKNGIIMAFPGRADLNSLAIKNNTFSPHLITTYTGSSTNYMTNAIAIEDPMADQNTPYSRHNIIGIVIENNLFYRVQYSIYLNGLNPHCSHYTTRKKVDSNTIIVEPDANAVFQYGISNVNADSWYNWNYSIQGIEQNSVTLYGASTSNTNVALIHANNTFAWPGGETGRVTCNTVTAGSQGFVFEGPNYGTYWRGNTMDALGRGMVLLNTGLIGPQGTSVAPSDNKWTGSWGSNSALYIASGSTAQASPLYIKSGSPWTPPTYGGLLPSTNWYSSSGGTLTSSGTYTCGGSYNQRTNSLPNEADYSSQEMFYIAKMIFYNALMKNDSVRGTNPSYNSFCSALSGTSVHKFHQVESYIYDGDLSSASSVLDGINKTGFNNVETNYFDFYTLYLKYKNNSPFTSGDTTSLSNLSALCPGENGAAIYKARALYHILTGKVYNASAGCDVAARKIDVREENNNVGTPIWNVTLFPNPAQDQLTIISGAESEVLHVAIRDLSGRIIIEQTLKTQAKIKNLSLDLVNGAYIISVSNLEGRNFNSRLLISK